jgi:hypothetical protein
MKRTIFFVLLFGYVLGYWNSALSEEIVNSSLLKEIQGAWVLYKDDDKPDQPIPNEKLFLYKDGRLLVDSSKRYYGAYEISGDQLIMMLSVNGREIQLSREFKLDDSGLHLANRKRGAAHHKRCNDLLPDWKLEEFWEKRSVGYISLKVPGGWKMLSEPPNEKGHQRLQLLNADTSKMILIVRTPLLKDLSQEQFSLATKELINDFLEASPMAGSVLNHMNSADLCGIKGSVYVAETRAQPKWTLKAVTTKTDETTVILMLVYHYDQLKELNKILRTTEVDGIKLSSN